MKTPCILLFFITFLIACDSSQKGNANITIKQETASNVATKASDSKEKKSILFFGDSLTAGYGLDEEEAYPYLIQEKIDSAALDYSVVNAGISGETTAEGLARIEWVLSQKVDVFFLALGANDMLRGLDYNLTEKNLNQIIEKVKATYPNAEIIIAGMYAPDNMGKEYSKGFAALFKTLSVQHGTYFMPFLLKDVAGIGSLNQSDGKHPNSNGSQIIAKNVWKMIQPVLK